MTVLPAPRRVVDGKPRTSPPRGGKRPCISVTADIHDRMKAAAKKFGCSMGDIVDEACAGILSGAAR